MQKKKEKKEKKKKKKKKRKEKKKSGCEGCMFQLVERCLEGVPKNKVGCKWNKVTKKTYHEGAGFWVIFYMQCALHSGGLAHSLNRIVVIGEVVRHVLGSWCFTFFGGGFGCLVKVFNQRFLKQNTRGMW